MPALKLQPLFEKKVDPVTEILRDVFKDNNYALSFLGALSIGIGVSQTNNLQAQDDVEEVIVTAAKKEQNIQGEILFCLFEDETNKTWRVAAVPVEDQSFVSRMKLKEDSFIYEHIVVFFIP